MKNSTLEDVDSIVTLSGVVGLMQRGTRNSGGCLKAQ